MVLLYFSGGYWGSKFRSSRCRVSAVLAEPSWEMPCVLSPLLWNKQPKLVVRLAVIFFSLVWNWITRFCWSELTRTTSLSCQFGQNFKGKITKGTGIFQPLPGSSSLHHGRSCDQALGVERNFTGHPNWGSCLLPYSSQFFYYPSKDEHSSTKPLKGGGGVKWVILFANTSKLYFLYLVNVSFISIAGPRLASDINNDIDSV